MLFSGLLGTVFWVFIGMMLGWVVIPQPFWAKGLYNMVVGLIKKPFNR